MRELQSTARCRFVALALVLIASPSSCRLWPQTAPVEPAPAHPPASAGAASQAAPTAPAAGPAAPPRFTPNLEMLAIQAASQKDRQRMMDLLGIKELRSGVDGGISTGATKATV